MKLFLSWSGELSHQVALAFRDWIPSVLQSVVPYVSSEDIEKGARWSSDISVELQASSYGILFVTRDNINAPWLNFEAGALSKAFDTSRVTPFLLGVKRSEVSGPMLQFQSTIYEMDDVKKLIFALNNADTTTQITESRLEGIFEVWWPFLKAQIDPLQEQAESTDQQGKLPTRSNSEILEEILELTRNQQKILSSPTTLFPYEYFADVIKTLQPRRERLDLIIWDLIGEWQRVDRIFASASIESSYPIKEIILQISQLRRIFLALQREYRHGNRRYRDLTLLEAENQSELTSSIKSQEFYEKVMKELKSTSHSDDESL